MSDTQSSNNGENVSSVTDQAATEELSEQGPKADAENLESLVDEWKSKAAYMAAELDNMKKRFVRERLEISKFANESLLKSIVPVLDNLSLALQSAKGAKEGDVQNGGGMLKALVEGVEMTLRHFEQTLTQVGVEFVKSTGEMFDPEAHEAVGQMQDPSKSDGVVLQEVQRGFKLSGRVVRTAKVIVNKTSN